MPVAMLTPQQWREIRTVAEMGKSLPEVARLFEVEYELVKKRAQRENWLTHAKVAKMAKAQEGQKIVSRSVPSASQAVGESLSERQTLHREQFHRIAVALAKRTEKAIEDGRIVPETIADVEKLQKITRLNLDMSTGESAPAIQMLFAGAEDRSTVPEAIETEAEVIEGEWLEV